MYIVIKSIYIYIHICILRELNGHLENNYLVIKSVVPYENKAVKSYFMDVSRANFYAKLCMKLGAYEKRL